MKVGELYQCPLGCAAPLTLVASGQNGQQLIVAGHLDGRGGVCSMAAGPVHPTFRPLKPFTPPAEPVLLPKAPVAATPLLCVCLDNDNDPACGLHSEAALLKARVRELEAQLETK